MKTLRCPSSSHWASAEARERHLRSGHFEALKRTLDDEGRLAEHAFYGLEPLPLEHEAEP